VRTLQQFRDATLDTFIGARIATMYYQNINEINAILQDNDELRYRFNELTRSNMTALTALLGQGSATIPADDLFEVYAFLADMQEQAGPGLRMNIDFVLRGIDSGWLLRWMGITIE
jgi:hypothetical protein